MYTLILNFRIKMFVLPKAWLLLLHNLSHSSKCFHKIQTFCVQHKPRGPVSCLMFIYGATLEKE